MSLSVKDEEPPERKKMGDLTGGVNGEKMPRRTIYHHYSQGFPVGGTFPHRN